MIERFQKYMDAKGLNDNQVTTLAGLSNGLIGKAKKSGKGLNSESIEKILLAFNDLSAEWLLTGKGPMFRDKRAADQSKPVAYSQEQASHPIVSDPIPRYKDEQNGKASAMLSGNGIPLIPLEAFAGFGMENGGQIMEYECEKYVVPDFRGAEFLIPVKGSSMYPKYSSGDIVACKKLPLDTFFQWNKVYVIDSEQGVLIKRVNPGNDADHITLVSENTKYPPFELHRKEILSLAIVIGVIRLE